MNLLILGLNHTTAPLSLREKLAFGPEELESSINMIRAMFGAPACGGIKEVAILSTCNRTEIYCAAEEPSAAFRSLQDFLVQSKHVSLTELEEQLYFLVQDDAIRHAFSAWLPVWIPWCWAKRRSSVRMKKPLKPLRTRAVSVSF